MVVVVNDACAFETLTGLTMATSTGFGIPALPTGFGTPALPLHLGVPPSRAAAIVDVDLKYYRARTPIYVKPW